MMDHKEKIKRVLEAKRIIETDFKEIQSIPKLAEKLDINSNDLTEVFSYVIGCNPIEYLNLIKLKTFYYLVKKDGGINKQFNYSIESGIYSTGSLSYITKKFAGCTPGLFIEKIRKGENFDEIVHTSEWIKPSFLTEFKYIDARTKSEKLLV